MAYSPAWEISFISASTYLLQSHRCNLIFTLGCTSPHNLFTCIISMRRLFSKYFPRWGSKPLDKWLQTQWNKAPGWSLVLRTGTSGLRRRNLCEVSISFIYSPWWTPPLGVPDSRWGVPARSYRPHLETSGTLIFILALHEPNLLRPRCASTACSGSFRALVSPSLHSSLESKLLVSHF